MVLVHITTGAKIKIKPSDVVFIAWKGSKEKIKNLFEIKYES